MKNVAAKGRLGVLLILFFVVLGLNWQQTSAQSDSPLYFPETGHIVAEVFREKFQSAPDPLLLYGYPITEAYLDTTSGRVVQYFQRARFELHSDSPPELRVRLSPLGEYVYKPGERLPSPESSSACRTFDETGFRVCYAFLEFFEAHGGVAQFGYPISNFEAHDERIVQYFQRARFEWHPEFPPGERVTLTDLGRRYFDLRRENKIRLLPVELDNILPTIVYLRVYAFPFKAVTGLSGSQTVYVLVKDQNLRPVPDAQVVLVVEPPDGPQGRYILPLTNEQGVTQYTFEFEAGRQGVAEMFIEASYEGIQKETLTSFRVWW